MKRLKLYLALLGLTIASTSFADSIVTSTGHIYHRPSPNYVISGSTGVVYYRTPNGAYVGSNGTIWQRTASGWISTNGNFVHDAYPVWRAGQYYPRYNQPVAPHNYLRPVAPYPYNRYQRPLPPQNPSLQRYYNNTGHYYPGLNQYR